MTMLTTAQVAQALGRSRRAVQDAIHRGTLPATKVGRDYQVDPEHVVAYQANHRGGAGRARDPQSRRLHVVGIEPKVAGGIRRAARHLGVPLPVYLTRLQRLHDHLVEQAYKGSVTAGGLLEGHDLWRDVEPGWEAFAEAYGGGLEARSADADR